MPQNPQTGRDMAPLSEVFGNARETPASMLQRAKVDNPASTAAPKAQDMALACPACAAQGKTGVRLYAKPDVGFFCLNEHRWDNIDTLMSLAPAKLPYVGLTARQDGWKKLTIEMPGSVLDDLEKKFGDRLPPTLRGVLETIATAKFMMITEEILAKIVEITGKEIQNATVLQGVIYDICITRDNLKEELRLLQEKGPAIGGTNTATSLPVELGSLYEKVTAKAQSQNWAPAELVRYCVEQCFANDWT